MVEGGVNWCTYGMIPYELHSSALLLGPTDDNTLGVDPADGPPKDCMRLGELKGPALGTAPGLLPTRPCTGFCASEANGALLGAHRRQSAGSQTRLRRLSSVRVRTILGGAQYTSRQHL